MSYRTSQCYINKPVTSMCYLKLRLSTILTPFFKIRNPNWDRYFYVGVQLSSTSLLCLIFSLSSYINKNETVMHCNITLSINLIKRHSLLKSKVPFIQLP